MQIPLQITFKNMDSSPALEALIREKAEKLERFSDRITSCRVVVEAPHRHKHKGKLYQVSIEITVPPGGDLVVNRGQNDPEYEDAYLAVRNAFDTAVRRVEEYERKLDEKRA